MTQHVALHLRFRAATRSVHPVSHSRFGVRTAVSRMAVSGLFTMALAVSWPVVGEPASYALRGTILTPTEVLDDSTVTVTDGVISSIGSNDSVAPGTRVVGVSGIIIPGLIDLHDHLTWNIFPRWRPPVPVKNRYEWQALKAYDAALRGPQAALIKAGLGCDMERYAEIKAIMGGATSVVGSLAPPNP